MEHDGCCVLIYEVKRGGWETIAPKPNSILCPYCGLQQDALRSSKGRFFQYGLTIWKPRTAVFTEAELSKFVEVVSGIKGKMIWVTQASRSIARILIILGQGHYYGRTGSEAHDECQLGQIAPHNI
jgi:hypothetical protein